jgi:catechol 2,3-dioxygenase-like lactoylglutathione lyase family enzyme
MSWSSISSAPPTTARSRVRTFSVQASARGLPQGIERPVSGVIDHVGIRVGDLPASRRMYEPALAELGFVVLSEGEFEGDTYVLFGRGDSDDFCLHTVGSKPGRDRVTTGAHIAFCAGDAGSVKRWHDAAVEHGGTDIGTPGVRPEYSGRYYAAFVLDPDGNNVEAVFHASSDFVAEG